MTCNETNLYLDRRDLSEAPAEVRTHLNTCQVCSRLLEAFRAARKSHSVANKRTQVPTELLENLEEVRPLPGKPFLLFACLIAAAVACSFGIALWGTGGWRAQTTLERFLLLGSIGIALGAIAYGLTTQMIPGSSSKISVAYLAVFSSVLFSATVLLQFHGSYPNLGSANQLCVWRGLLIVVLAWILAYFTIKRGALLDRSASYLLLGGFAACASLLVQTVYCPFLTTQHVFVSHGGTSVLAFLCGWLFSRRFR